MITKATFKHFFRSLTLVVLFAIIAQTANAQGFLAQKDLSQFKVEMLSEADISKIKERLQSSELSIDQIKTQTSAKGLPAGEFEKLRTRLSATNNATNTIGTKIESVQSNREGNATSNASSFKEAEVAANSLVFGSELFQNAGSLTSNANIATPLNYEVGPNDILKLVLFREVQIANNHANQIPLIDNKLKCINR